MARIRTIKPEDAAEFRGFFFGEGHLDLVRQSAVQRSLYPRARIALREDDLTILQWVQALFGGSLLHRPSTRSWCWQLTGREAMANLLNVLCGGQMPSKKRREVRLMQEAVSLVSARGRHQPDEAVERLHSIRDELKALRQFNGGV